MGNIYVLSHNQLKVLLLSCGFTYVKGITLDDSVVDDQMTINVLNDLMKNDLVENTGEAFYINDELREIIVTLGSAEEFSVIRSSDKDLPDLFCYKSEKLLICSSRGLNQNCYSLYFANNSQLLETLENEGYFPNVLASDYFDEAKSEHFEKHLVYEPELPLDSQMSVKFAMEKALFSTEKHRYIRVIEYHLFTYILFNDGENEHRYLYTKDKLKEKILKLLEI